MNLQEIFAARLLTLVTCRMKFQHVTRFIKMSRFLLILSSGHRLNCATHPRLSEQSIEPRRVGSLAHIDAGVEWRRHSQLTR